MPYLEVYEDFAHGFAHEPRFGHVPKNGWWQTEQDDEEVGHRQVNNENIGDGSHRVVRVHGYAYQCVANL